MLGPLAILTLEILKTAGGINDFGFRHHFLYNRKKSLLFFSIINAKFM
jgi:hypothetical protein